MKKEFGSAIPNAVKSLNSNLTDLSNEWLLLKRDVGEAFLPVMLKTVRFLKEDVIPALRTVGHFVEDHKNLFLALASALTVGYTAFKLAAAGAWLLNTALAVMELKPIILAVTALAGAVAYLVSEYKDLAEAMNAKMHVVGLPQWEKRHEGMDFGNTSDIARRLSVDELREMLKRV
jgi:hypothetical protein